jgi:hypothetical protein
MKSVELFSKYLEAMIKINFILQLKSEKMQAIHHLTCRRQAVRPSCVFILLTLPSRASMKQEGV